MDLTTSTRERNSGDESVDSSPDSSPELDSPLNEMVKTLADEDEEENADLAYAVGVDDEPIASHDDDERPTE